MNELIDSLTVRQPLKAMLHNASDYHHDWVENWGLQTGKLGPLDELIWELDKCLQVAEQVKKRLEEE